MGCWCERARVDVAHDGRRLSADQDRHDPRAGDGAGVAGRVSNTRGREHRVLPQLIFTSGAVTLHVPPDWTVVAALPFSVMFGAVRLSALAATRFSVAAA